MAKLPADQVERDRIKRDIESKKEDSKNERHRIWASALKSFLWLIRFFLED